MKANDYVDGFNLYYGCLKGTPHKEKGSDVNLATHLLVDAFDHDCEASIVISNDSDLVLPVQVRRDRFGLTVGVLPPHTHPSIELQRAANFCRPIRAGPLRAGQFPHTMTDSNETFTKPPGW